MPAYRPTGLHTTAPTARLIGIGLVAVIVLGVTAWRLAPTDDSPAAGSLSLTLLTDEIGEGISSGSEVRRDGVLVGTVESVGREAGGRRLVLTVDEKSVDGLSDTLSIEYAPANLFGITAVALLPGQGGSALNSNALIDLTGTDRVHDATTSELLLSLGRLTEEVLSPDLAALVERVARDTKAFAPLLEAVVTTVESVADTQRMPYSPILAGIGDALQGLPSTLSGGLVLLNSVYEQPYLRSDTNRANFDTTVSMLAEGVIPLIANLLRTIQPDYHPLADMAVPLLEAVGDTVTPADAAAVSTLTGRIDRALLDSPAGPILRLAVTLDTSGERR